VYEEEGAVLRHFFVAGRLRELPAKKGKRLIVLTRLALDFEPGVRYPEAEVNAQLKRYHPDFASLRRALVDEGLLSRAAGASWRTGGPTEVGPAPIGPTARSHGRRVKPRAAHADSRSHEAEARIGRGPRRGLGVHLLRAPVLRARMRAVRCRAREPEVAHVD